MKTNLDLWKRVSKTDPRHVKQITGKQYSGNSPKPYYIVERLTEEFGPCGSGWGFTILSERMERLTEDDVLHIAHVRLWYVHEGKRGEFDQMGQTKACYRTSKGAMLVDEDSPKKSVTDALVKCASYLGFAGDIFSGRWDDSKYVAELRAEFSNGNGKQQHEPRGVVADVLSQMPPADEEVMDYLRSLKSEVIATMKEPGGQARAFDRIERDKLDNDQMIHLWSLLPSNVRSALKIEKGLRIGAG